MVVYMKIAIIEDEQVHAELLAGYLRDWGVQEDVHVMIQYYTSAENFLLEWETERDFDVLFVDIQMKKMNGMEMAKTVRRRDVDISIIFTTGISEYIGEGYEVGAVHYLLKPISRDKIRECMDKVRERNCDIHYLLVHAGDETYKLAAERINYVEARGHGCEIEIVKGKKDKKETERIEVSESISELERRMGDWGMIRCHRSYLCGLANIHHIGRTEISFDSGSRIPVSRRMYKDVNQAFIRYFRNEA
jgi:Response regulator of the LytR/AlgR family